MIALLFALLAARDDLTDLVLAFRAAAPADQPRIGYSFGQYAKPTHVPLLFKEADAGPANARLYFILALGRVGSADAKEALRELCQRHEPVSRADAATQLAYHKDDFGLKIVVSLLLKMESDNDRIAVVARLAGGNCESPEAARGLIQFLEKEKRADIRRMALRTLGSVKDPSVAVALRKVASDAQDPTRYDAMAYLAQKGDEAALESSLKALETEKLDVNTSYQILLSVQILNKRSELPRLRELADKSSDPSLRMYIAQFLGWMKDDKAAAVLTRLAEDSNPAVAKAASDALLQVGGQGQEERVKAAAQDADSRKRLAAAEAMLQLDKMEGLDEVKTGLADGDSNDRRKAAMILADVHRRQAVEILLSLLDDSEEIVRTQSRRGLLSALGALYPYLRFDAKASPEKLRAWWAKNK